MLAPPGILTAPIAPNAKTAPQRKWLERIGQELKVEVIAFEWGQFKAQRGVERINKAFDGKVEEILVEINNTI